MLADTGATKHVTQKDIFGTEVKETDRSKANHKFYAANGQAIPNLGGQTVAGTSVNNKKIGMEFNVGEISRPIASVGEILTKNNRAVFDQDDSYIENKTTGAWIPLRREGNLFYLDLWCQVPAKLTTHPFVRQVQQ